MLNLNFTVPLRDYAPITIASRSEAACLFALNKYCKFKPVMGVNLQVPLSNQKRADFLIDNTYIEYHPIILRKEFDSRYAQHRYDSVIKKIPNWVRHEVAGILQTEFFVRYYNARRLLIEQKDGPTAELVVATCPTDFYNKVIKRFSDNVPRCQAFLQEFFDNKSKEGFQKILEKFKATKV